MYNMSSQNISGISGAVAAQELYLTDFNQSITLSELASLVAVSPISLDPSAIATFEMPASAWRSCFQFSIDNVVQLTDPNGNLDDLHFYVVDPSANLGTSHMGDYGRVTVDPVATHDMKSGAAFVSAQGPTNQMSIAQDYVRYLAEEIFGTYAGVDLFYNETALVQSVVSQVAGVWNASDIAGILVPISSTAAPVTPLQEDTVNGLSYLDNSVPSGYLNIGKTLFDQIVNLNPTRFAVAGQDGNTTGLLEDTASPQPIPLMAGDSISFMCNISPHAGQEKLTNLSTEIPTRCYQIKIVLTA